MSYIIHSNEQGREWVEKIEDTTPSMALDPLRVAMKRAEVSEGRKDDANKPRFDLLPGDALEEIAIILTSGASHYGDRNWEAGMAWHRPFGALMRHMWRWWQGEALDPDSGRTHLAHAACCVLFLISYEKRGIGKDDRPCRQS